MKLLNKVLSEKEWRLEGSENISEKKTNKK